MTKNKYYKINYKRTFAFTLAEVLLTLAIIGIVSTITIPALLINIQDVEFKSAWKKIYSDLDQATKKIMIENGGTMENFTSQQLFVNQYKKHLTYTKECGYSNYNDGNCWPPSNYYYFNKSLFVDSGNTPWGTKLVLSNGMLLSLRSDDSTCSSSGMASFKEPQVCGQIHVDVNGWKGPNTFGKDVFGIWVKKTGIKPKGDVEDIYYKECSTSGYGCGALYLKN